MTPGHPALCICAACATRRETVLRQEVATLKGLVRELAAALDVFADADDSLEVSDLINRARERGTP